MRSWVLPSALLALLFVGVAGWTWSWPDAPLIPDEAIAKVMVDSVAERGTPFAVEPITDYQNAAFGVERYGSHYQNHTLVRPAVGIGVAFEQGLFGVKLGRAITFALGTAAIAYLGARLGGPWTGFFAGALYLTHPATLYFHQSYFANSGGLAWFLAALALLEASRDRWWLAPLSVAAAGVSFLFRIEYAIGFLAVVAIAFGLGPLRSWRAASAFLATTGSFALVLATLPRWSPSLSAGVLFTEGFDLGDAVRHPIRLFLDSLDRYSQRSDVGAFLSPTFIQHANDYFLYFFPLVGLLAIAGLFVRARRPEATWVFVPFAFQSLAMAFAVLPTFGEFDFSNVSWLESSIARYFLLTYAFLALLAALPLGVLVEAASRVPMPHPRLLAAIVLASLVVSANLVHAQQAEHGVAWANERRGWFLDIEETAATFGSHTVVVGVTPSKFVFDLPVLAPNNVRGGGKALTAIATDLVEQGRPVLALEPWFWADKGFAPANLLLAGGHTYWTDTGVTVPGPEGQVARFYELQVTNATLSRVERLDTTTWATSPDGNLTTKGDRAFFWPERALHLRMGAGIARSVNVTLEVRGAGQETAEAGYVNLPVDRPKNLHPLVSWSDDGAQEWRTVSFVIPSGTVVNGPFYLSGGLEVRGIGVKEA